jgi:hypothetical protein
VLRLSLRARGPQNRHAVLCQRASVDTTWVEPILILALPFAGHGHLTTMQRVGDDLFDQFRRQGAFAAQTVLAAE